MKSQSRWPTTNQRYWQELEHKVKESKKVDLSRMQAKDVMKTKYLCVSETVTMMEVLQELRNRRESVALVVNSEGVPVGTLTEQELISFTMNGTMNNQEENLLEYYSRRFREIVEPESQMLLAKSWMFPQVYVVDYASDLDDICRVFNKKNVSALFVRKSSQIMGVVTITDIVSKITELVYEQTYELFGLDRYSKNGMLH